jgi:hypothetical protein
MDADDWDPDRQTYEAHLKSVRFLAGIEEGRWQVLASDFPHLYVRVLATDPETGASAVQDFHLVCDGYPFPGPFVERWDFNLGTRPTPPASDKCSPGFCDALKDWSPGGDVHGGIYRAWQRYAGAHNDWTQKRPDEAWHRQREIAFVMERLYDLVVEQAVWLGFRQQAA